MFEVEQKFWVDDEFSLLASIQVNAANEHESELHSDHYFNHPVRDFRTTGEVLRLRRINGIAHVTYKGPRLAGRVKARHELEYSLSPGDHDGTLTESLWLALGFHSVATVTKLRRIFRADTWGSDLVVTLDRVDEIGVFSEIELVVSSEADVTVATERILRVAAQLGLTRVEPRSYLGLLMSKVTS
jgi:adenylate cyclase class 2